MTREKDKGLNDENSSNKKAQDMQRRIAFLNDKNPVLTVSIHQNSYSDPAVNGPQVFYYENSEEGKKFAEYVQESLNRTLAPGRPRKVKGKYQLLSS